MLQKRIQIASEAIISIHPDHKFGGYEDFPKFTWEYDETDDTIYLSIISTYEENTSCNCHPEYETRETTTYHTIPSEEFTSNMDDEAWEFEQTTWYKNLKQKREADIAAEAEKRRKEAALRAEQARLAREQKERAELARLQNMYGNK